MWWYELAAGPEVRWLGFVWNMTDLSPGAA
jgi:hypothetical protein